MKPHSTSAGPAAQSTSAQTAQLTPLPTALQPVLASAQAQPWRHSFVALMRQLAAQSDMPPVGRAQRPQQENFRLGQTASLGFAPREIERVQVDPHQRVHIQLYGLGMLGPNGSLPLHVSELVQARVQTKRDHTLANFLDLFHHRAFSHIYRAWAQSQSAAGLDRATAETFTPYIARLAGDEPTELQDTQRHPLSPHARWASAAHRIRAARNPEGLVHTLQHYFAVPVKLLEYQLHWMPLQNQDQTQLGRPLPSSLMGQGAVAGQTVPDRQSKFRLVIGPLSLHAYLRLTPAGKAKGEDKTQGKGQSNDLDALIELVRAFVGYEYVWDVQLLMQREQVQTAQLGGAQQLGWTTWLAQSEEQNPSQEPIEGMVMEPEAYATH